MYLVKIPNQPKFIHTHACIKVHNIGFIVEERYCYAGLNHILGSHTVLLLLFACTFSSFLGFLFFCYFVYSTDGLRCFSLVVMYNVKQFFHRATFLCAKAKFPIC